MFERSTLSNKKPLINFAYIFWATLLLTMIARYTYLGLNYYPVLDDNNMYGFIFNSYTSKEAFIRLATSRPIAYFFDCFIISRLWRDMWIVLIMITILHWLCCIILFKIFGMLNINIGYFSIIYFALAPFSTEATYWISASSRLVIGLFFSLSSIYILVACVTCKRITSKQKLFIYYSLFWLLNLLSMGFYEQITVISFIIPVIIFVFYYKKLKHKWVIALSFFNISIFVFYYKYFNNVGQIASRGQLISGGFLSHTKNVIKAIRNLAFNEQWLMIKNGIARGLELVVSNGYWLIILIITVVILSICSSISLKSTNNNKNIAKKLILSFILFFLPFAPFFVLDKIYIANRNVFLSLFSIGILVETLLCVAFKWDKMKIGVSIINGVMCALFLLTNVSEINDYRNVSMIDQEIVTNLAHAYSQADENGKDGTLLFNAKDIYTDVTQKHFSNCTAADWALTGAVQSLANDIPFGVVHPIKKEVPINIPIIPEINYSYYGINENLEIFHLDGAWSGEDLILKKDDGSVFGVIISDGEGNQALNIFE